MIALTEMLTVITVVIREFKLHKKSFSLHNVDKEKVGIFYYRFLQFSLTAAFFSQVALAASRAFGGNQFFNVEDDQKVLVGR